MKEKQAEFIGLPEMPYSKITQTGWLQQWIFISHRSIAWEVQRQQLILFLERTSFLTLQVATFWPCSHNEYDMLMESCRDAMSPGAQQKIPVDKNGVRLQEDKKICLRFNQTGNKGTANVRKQKMAMKGKYSYDQYSKTAAWLVESYKKKT